jgi:hypothetical protein
MQACSVPPVTSALLLLLLLLFAIFNNVETVPENTMSPSHMFVICIRPRRMQLTVLSVIGTSMNGIPTQNKQLFYIL